MGWRLWTWWTRRACPGPRSLRAPTWRRRSLSRAPRRSAPFWFCAAQARRGPTSGSCRTSPPSSENEVNAPVLSLLHLNLNPAMDKQMDLTVSGPRLGLHLVVVLTHRNSLRGAKQSEELRREVALRAKTDSVYLIENYTATAFKNSFSTHCNALAIIRQCVEFAAMHRRHRATAAQKSSPPSPLGAQKSVFE